MIKIFIQNHLKAVKSNIPTSHLIKKDNKGFSLLEIVVVIMIIGAIMSIAVPKMFGSGAQDHRKIFRSLTAAIKEVRNRAKLYGTTYRLAFRLDQGQQAYWVERATSITYIDKAAFEKAREAAKNNFREDENKPQAPSPFQPDTSYYKKEQTLPDGFSFKHVESGSLDLVITEGTAYIHFFPQGFIEPAAIQIVDPKKNIWTLVFNSITGQADIIDSEKTLKDLQR